MRIIELAPPKTQKQVSKFSPLTSEIVGKTSDGRNVFRNEDGTRSSERSATEEVDGQFLNFPTIFGGKELTRDEAFDIVSQNNFVDPETGRKLNFFNTLDEAESAAKARSENMQIQSNIIELTPPIRQKVSQEEASLFTEFGRDIGGAVEAGLNIGTSIFEQGAGGIAALAKLITSGEEEANKVLDNFRGAFTFQPRTERGKQFIKSIGEALSPIGEKFKELESTVGDFVFEKTQSPALAAIATTFPTLISEIASFGAGKVILKGAKKAPKTKQVSKAFEEASPSIDQLKSASREVFKEIDDLGGSIRSQAYQDLVTKLNKSAKDAGLSAGGTPKANAILNEFNELLGKGKTTVDPVTGVQKTSRLGRDISLSELDDLRIKAQGVAKSTEAAERSVGVSMIDTIDSFLDSVKDQAIKVPKGSGANIGKRYRIARELWGRAKRSEMIQEAFEKAGRQASGFENGIRTQFRQILNNKKRSRFFNKEELAAMDSVVKGTKKQNFFKLLGRFGFSEGQATNIIGGSISTGAGGAIGGTPGAIILPGAATMARDLAQKLTAKGAMFADDVIRSGRNGKRIVSAYLKHVPKGKRSAEELSQLLLKPDVDLSAIKSGGKIVDDAILIARQRRKALGIAAGVGGLTQVEPES